MKGFLTTTGKTRRFISWFLASLLVISSFMYGGVTKVHAEEIDGATQLDAGEQGDQVDAPETVEQVNEEALPEAEVPEEEGIIGDPQENPLNPPTIATDLVFNGTNQQLLTAPASKKDEGTTGVIRYGLSADELTTSNYYSLTQKNAGTYKVFYGLEVDDEVTVYGSVRVEIAQRDIERVYQQRYGGNSPYTYTGNEINPNDFQLREYRNRNGWGNVGSIRQPYTALVKDTDFEFAEDSVFKATDAGEYSVTANGIGNYTGSVTINWSIEKNTYRYYSLLTILNYDIRVQDYTGTYNGQEHGLTVTLQNRARGANFAYLVSKDGEEFGPDSEEWDSKDVVINPQGPKFKDAGTYTVSYKVYDNAGLYEPYFGTATITINKKDATINVTDVEKVYDGKPFDDIGVEVASVTGLVGEDTIEGIDVALSEDALESVDVGDYPIIVKNAEELAEKYPNYNLSVSGNGVATIKKRPVSISLKEEKYSKIYSEDPIDFAAEMEIEEFDEENKSGLVEGDKIVGEPVIMSGRNRVVDSRTLNANTYNLAQYSGEYGILPSANPNYDISFTNSTYEVEKKELSKDMEIEFSEGGTGFYVYTGSNINVDLDVYDYVDDVNYIRNSDYSLSGTVSAKNIGEYEVRIEATPNGNYTGEIDTVWTIAEFADGELEYNGEAQMLALPEQEDPNVVEIAYSATPVTEEVTLDNYAEYYTIDDTDALAEALKSKNVGEYPFYYVVVFDDGVFQTHATLTITPYELEVQLENEEKEFDGTTLVKFDDTEVETVGEEEITFSNITGNLEDSDSNFALGLDEDYYRDVTIDEESVVVTPANDGTKLDNYSISFDIAGCAVYCKELTDDDITLTVADKQYDGTDIAEATITVDTGIEGQEIIFKDIVAYFEDADVEWKEGTVVKKPVDIYAFAVAGNDATSLDNYKYVSINAIVALPENDLITLPDEEEDEGFGAFFLAEAYITPREILVTPSSGTKVYDGKVATTETINPTFTVEGVDEEIAENDDFAEQLLSEPETVFTVKLDDKVEAKNAGEYALLVYTDDEYADEFVEGNFSLGINQGTYTITPKAVTVKVEDASKKVGDKDPVFKYTVTGLVDGESLKNIKVTRVVGETPGTYKVNATCDADKNYTITFVDGTFTIESTYKSEWVDGQWYDADGKASYEPKGSWKQNDTGWWYEDTSGWYPVMKWQKIDGLWYYFGVSGYMAANEWIDGWWCNADGSCTYEYQASWKQDANGWWYGDASGWYAKSEWQKIDNIWYYFGDDGYLATSQYVGTYWVNADGAWAE
ncbi:MAG: hypothetical protein J5929_04790 [Eubacterium sp.]|nr:hypothetical protein [Eubacterium sp.]